MTRIRTLILAALAPATLLFANSPPPAAAQELGAWGMWGGWNNEKGRRHSRNATTQYQYGLSTYGNSNRPNGGHVFPAYMTGGPQPNIEPAAPETIAFPNTQEPGTIIIDTDARTLYYTLNSEIAYAYPISVGRAGYTWSGTENISRIKYWPDWHPPKEMREREPGLPIKMTGGIRNPLGAVAIYLGDTLYRIHGTNDAKTIGQAASSGCIRMLNRHAMHLARIAYVGTTVKVIARIEDLDTISNAEPTTTRAGG